MSCVKYLLKLHVQKNNTSEEDMSETMAVFKDKDFQ